MLSHSNNDWFFMHRHGPEEQIRLLSRQNDCIKKRIHFMRTNSPNKSSFSQFFCHKTYDGEDRGSSRWVGHCFLCQKYAELWGKYESDSQVIKVVRLLKPSERYYFNIIDRKREEAGPLMWATGRALYKKIIDHCPPPENVRGDLRIVKKMKLHFPDYSESRFLPDSPIGTQEQIKSWNSSLHDLKAQIKLDTESDLVDVFENNIAILLPKGKVKKWRSIDADFQPSW